MASKTKAPTPESIQAAIEAKLAELEEQLDPVAITLKAGAHSPSKSAQRVAEELNDGPPARLRELSALLGVELQTVPVAFIGALGKLLTRKVSDGTATTTEVEPADDPVDDEDDGHEIGPVDDDEDDELDPTAGWDTDEDDDD